MTDVIVLDVVTMMDCYVLVVVSDEKRINGGAPELVVLGLLQSQIVKDLQWLPNVWLLWLWLSYECEIAMMQIGVVWRE